MSALQTLNMKHFMIAHLLAQGRTQASAARRLNVSTATIQNCLETPEFLETLESLKAEYAEKLTAEVVIPFAEMQRKINAEAYSALGRVVDISCAERGNQTVLNANLALLDRASNTPKASKIDSSETTKELFNVSVVQLVLETASQIGDKTVIASAQRAIESIAPVNPEKIHEVSSARGIEEDVVDIPTGAVPAPFQQFSSPTPFAMKSLDDVLYDIEDEEEE